MRKCLWLGGMMLAAIALTPGPALADLAVGTKVSNVTLRNAQDKPSRIPDLGKKVLTIFYVDPDEKEQNEKFSKAVKEANFDKYLFRKLGVVNMEDTWKPNFLIRKMIRSNQKAFGSMVLMDPEHFLKKAWKIGKTNDTVVVMVIGSDSKVKFLKHGALNAAERKSTIELIKKLLAKDDK